MKPSTTVSTKVLPPSQQPLLQVRRLRPRAGRPRVQPQGPHGLAACQSSLPCALRQPSSTECQRSSGAFGKTMESFSEQGNVGPMGRKVHHNKTTATSDADSQTPTARRPTASSCPYSPARETPRSISQTRKPRPEEGSLAQGHTASKCKSHLPACQ